MKLLGYIRRSQDSGTGVSEEIQRDKIKQWAALYDHQSAGKKSKREIRTRHHDRGRFQKTRALKVPGKQQREQRKSRQRVMRQLCFDHTEDDENDRHTAEQVDVDLAAVVALAEAALVTFMPNLFGQRRQFDRRGRKAAVQHRWRGPL